MLGPFQLFICYGKIFKLKQLCECGFKSLHHIGAVKYCCYLKHTWICGGKGGRINTVHQLLFVPYRPVKPRGFAMPGNLGQNVKNRSVGAVKF